LALLYDDQSSEPQHDVYHLVLLLYDLQLQVVKYHLGGIKTTDSYGTMQRIALANNPSHLEIVAPVVEGRTRAAQDDTQRAGAPTTDHHKAFQVTWIVSQCNTLHCTV
jgi:2-oxoglutarate dehydrogenase complex dehydrogenase (E1) component-like enzyme